MMYSHLLRDLLAVDTEHPHAGICAQLPDPLDHDWLDERFDFQEKVFKAWPLFSGNILYPVPHPDTPPSEAYQQALDTNTMWVGPYGDNRWNLLEFWIEKTVDAMILQSLQDLKFNGPQYPRKGICGHIPLKHRMVVYHRLCQLFTQWPQFSGDRQFPVSPGSDAYYSTEDLWDRNTTYGQARYDLLDFLIKELSDAQL